MNKNKQKIIELLQSGKFTIIYWDSDQPTLYKGRWNKDTEYNRDEYQTMTKSEVEVIDWSDGYCPTIVELLVEALNGKSDSI